MKKFHFDSSVAEKVGVNAAVLYDNIRHWCEKNSANSQVRNFHEGKYWTYNSSKAFAILFPFLSPRQIVTALDKLVEFGFIEKGNFNKISYDRTTWYCDLMAETPICQKSKMDLTKKVNGFDQNVSPIPYNKPDSKPDIKIYKSDFEVFWEAYGQHGSKKLSLAKYLIARRTAEQNILLEAIKTYDQHLKVNEWKQKRSGQAWLHQEGWNDIFEKVKYVKPSWQM